MTSTQPWAIANAAYLSHQAIGFKYLLDSAVNFYLSRLDFIAVNNQVIRWSYILMHIVKYIFHLE